MKKFKPHTLPPRKSIMKPTVLKGISREEISLYNTVKLMLPQVPIYQSDRTLLHGKEIDIYLPTFKLGIEYDGLYWHNNSSGKGPDYHLYKTEEAEKLGIDLLHIWSSEWERKRSLVVDLIQRRTGGIKTLDVSACGVSVVTKASGSNFLNMCHLQGDNPSADLYIGISYQDNLIAVISARKEDNKWIILRYVERRQLHIIDGLKAMIQELLKTEECDIIFIFDRRLFTGKEFTNLGFKLLKTVPPRKWITKNYREMYLAEGFNESIDLQDYHVIYDCGLKYLIYQLQEQKSSQG